MIKANDLRIGNVVMDGEPLNGRAGTILSINDRSVRLRMEHSTQLIHGNKAHYKPNELPVYPIPLVGEWAERCGILRARKLGFVWCVMHLRWIDQNLFLCDEQSNEIIEIKYVHELQNIYYALQSQELVINIYDRVNLHV